MMIHYKDSGKSDETVTLLSKLRNSENHIEVQLDMSELDLTTAEIKATYDESAVGCRKTMARM